MTRVCSIFSQILQLIPRLEFEFAARKHNAERHARGFTCWGQFVAMLFCQLGHAKSLREICGGLEASEGKLRHLGLPSAPPRSTLAYANEHRPWQIYQTVFHQLLEKDTPANEEKGRERLAGRRRTERAYGDTPPARRDYLRLRVVVGFIRKRERASPRFCRKASELYTSVSILDPSFGAMGSTSSSWNSRATSSTVLGWMGRWWSTNALTRECSQSRLMTRGIPSE